MIIIIIIIIMSVCDLHTPIHCSLNNSHSVITNIVNCCHASRQLNNLRSDSDSTVSLINFFCNVFCALWRVMYAQRLVCVAVLMAGVHTQFHAHRRNRAKEKSDDALDSRPAGCLLRPEAHRAAAEV